jgi:molybdopterin/thiamine biosynthesis adenylyltransferase/nitroreductase
MPTQTAFAYDVAFSRNLGWTTEGEQLALRGKCVAIAGLGGVGGAHLLTLARLGIGAFHIADFDRFDLANFNRQIGATMQTLGRPKTEVLAEMARDISPELRIVRFDAGVTDATIDAFLSGVDLFVDGLDFFVIGMRRKVFRRCAELGIPAVTAAPIGMGTAYLAFMPGGMSFEDYFRLEGQPENEQYLRFLLGLTPRGLHRRYLVDPTRVDLAAKRGPSTIAGCQLCAGVTATMALKVLLGRGDLRPAPWHHHFDAYRGKLAIVKLRNGNAGWMQRLKLHLARKAIAGLARNVPAANPPALTSPLMEILSAARWAPSGDNEQAWRFERRDDDSVAIRLAAPTGANVYEYRGGEPLLLAGGMLLESLRIAATAHGRTMAWRHQGNDWPGRIDVRFDPTENLRVDPLYSSLGLRSVDRRPYRDRALREHEQAALRDAIGDDLLLDWYPHSDQRRQFARISALATDIRLRAPETFATHRKVVDWERRLSPSGIPAGALGLDWATLKAMRWSMRRWSRTRLLNGLGGTLMAARQTDTAPILGSAACFTVRLATHAAERGPNTLLRAGEHLQRFWLTATRLGLAMQPLLAPLIFADYGEKGVSFTTDAAVQAKAATLAASFRQVVGAGTSDFVFMGRIGEPRSRQPECRSVRRPLAELMEAADTPST